MKRVIGMSWVRLGVLSFVVFLALLLAGTVAAQGPLADSYMPVTVRGAELPGLLGAPTASLWVYANPGGALVQIPVQIDQIVSGVYSGAPATTLAEEDEIFFMAADMGTLVTPAEIATTLPISATWYQIVVTDAYSPTLKAYAYVVQSDAVTPTTTSYVFFDEGNQMIEAVAYDLGLLAGHPGFDYLALNGSGVDLLDRTKIRISAFGGMFKQTENDLAEPAANVLANGPVRAIIQGGGTIAYRSMVQTVLVESMAGVDAVRLSTDFAAAAAGSTLYNANVNAGVTVDGAADVVPIAESVWWQLSGSTGTLVQAVDATQVGGTQSTYYKDDATVDLADTGDQMSYGDIGLMVNSPNASVVYRQALVVLPPNLPNMGLLVAAGADPARLLVATAIQSAPPEYPNVVYLPLVIKGE